MGEVSFDFQKDKFKELIVYFVNTLKDDSEFNSIKLQKLLYHSDFTAYGRLGQPITGAHYIHKPAGPVASEMNQVKRELELAGRVSFVSVKHAGRMVERAELAVNKPANMDSFSEPEIEICNEVLRRLRDKTEWELSDATHNWIGWLYTDDGQEIPYSSVFIKNRNPVPKAGFVWAERVLQAK